ncbi:F0F1 ATP synthase subunit delta [Thiohalocapsa marina]|uniref:F0F1 ATP synthase subunit delta n=1 Tax=Thiohalocapsa marina TaxID=424902 RepID=UPI0036DE72C0
MGLDWSTFLLEIANFLILVWILKHFLYAPVKAAIEQRHKRVAAIQAQAEATRSEAEQMRADYASRLGDWERERAEARAELDRELAAERSRRLEEQQAERARARDKAAVLDDRERRQRQRQDQQRALALAAGFAGRLLTRLADVTLEARLCDVLLEDLNQLPEAERAALASAADAGTASVRIQSAFDLPPERREAIGSALSEIAGRPLEPAFAREPALIAGLLIEAGPLILRANLRDELRVFSEIGQ